MVTSRNERPVSATAVSGSEREARRWIDAHRTALAEAVVARLYELQPGLRERYGKDGQDVCVQDTSYHLAQLSACLWAGCSPLLADYLAWARAVLIARRVDPEDVRKSFACLAEVVREALPAEPGEVAARFLEAALAQPPIAQADLPSFLVGEDDLTQLARQYLDALLEGHRYVAARLILDAADRGVPISDLYLGVFQPCQREVGRLWQLGLIGVDREHYSSAATQLIMSRLSPRLFATPRNGHRLVAACPGGETHEIGLRVVADLFELDGWDTLYLGSNVPVSAIVRAVADHQAEVLLLSATMAYHLPVIEEVIAAVQSSGAGDAVKVLVGGGPFLVAPELWQKVGADGWAVNAAEALAAAERLLTSREVRRLEGGGSLGTATSREDPQVQGRSDGRPSLYVELSELNSELVAMQRELARNNAGLERLNQQLAEADRRKDEWVSVLAHELRSPLAPLRNALQVSRQPEMSPAVLGRMQDVMGRQVEQLARLVDDLLDLSRVARGKMELRREWVSLAEVVERATETARPVMEARHHKLTVSVSPPDVGLWADPARLEQVLTNLLNNAARYTPEGGQVWVTAAREGDEVASRVADNGIGIPSEVLPSIFGLFAQADRPQERAEGGLGIGLALVKSLVELHGGTVEAHSEGPGRGSEFVIRLPVSPEQPRPGSRRLEQESPTEENSVKVLLVDDHVDAAESLALLLRLWGHEVAVVHDGPGAIRAAEEDPPKVVLLDIGLPGMDGYEVARQLRSKPTLSGTRLVALTGRGQEKDRQRVAEAGFDHHMLKPVALDELQRMLVGLPAGAAETPV